MTQGNHVVINLRDTGSATRNVETDVRVESTSPAAREPSLPDAGLRSPRHWRVVARLVDLSAVGAVGFGVLGSGQSAVQTLQIVGVAVAVALLRLGVGRRQSVSLGKARTVETMELAAVSLEVGLALLLVQATLLPPLHLTRVAVFSVVLVFGLAIGRALTRVVARRLPEHWTSPQRVVLVGDDEEATWLYRLMSEYPELALTVVGRVGHPLDIHPGLRGLPWLGTLHHIRRITQSAGATSIVIAGGGLGPDALGTALRELQSERVDINVSAGLGGLDPSAIKLSTLGVGSMVRVRTRHARTWQAAVKRSVDIVGSAVVLALASPLIALAAVGIRAGGDGPVLFRQSRIGQDGRSFTLLKFRTMVCDAEQRKATLAQQNERTGPLFKIAHDPRVTRLGRFLRASSIDELPQLVNVLRGEMSLVGPRPALPEEAAAFEGRLVDRNRVLPGLTGLWQVEARDNPSFFSYEMLDLYYVDNWSLRLDFVIMVTTVPVVMHRGVRSLVDVAKRAVGRTPRTHASAERTAAA
ncbi:sugar transferase [Euzebya tangerina]|uniref:sugar transferase n=1 Tax=Euzebya tangerina TaxID=591198 RepID=UPI0013C31282|nr:sugar transferase [Euzebya tangerina]